MNEQHEQIREIIEGIISGLAVDSSLRGISPTIMAACAMQAAAIMVAWASMEQSDDWENINEQMRDLVKNAFYWGTKHPLKQPTIN